MATAIKSIPVLRGREATKFVKRAAVSSSKRASVDFSTQVTIASKILQKAKLK